MALRSAGTWVWTGTTDTVYSTSTNWTIDGGAPDADDYPGWDNSEAGGTNVDNDIVILTGTVTNGCATNAGFDAGSKGKLKKFVVTDTYTGAIGKSGGVLELSMDTTSELLIDGTAAGNIYINGDATNYLGIVTLMDLKSTSTATLGGKLGTVNLLKGTCVLAASTTVATALNVGYLSNPSTDVTLTIPSTTTLTPAAIDAQGGTVSCSIAVGTLRIGQAVWTQAAGNLTTVYQSGGQLKWNAGAITTCYLYRGTLDARGTTALHACTTLYQYEGSTVNINDGERRVTVTTWYLMCENPSITVTPGTSIGVTGY